MMSTDGFLKTATGYLWRVPLCALAYVVGSMVAGFLVPWLGLALPAVPETVDETALGQLALVGSLALALGVGPLARRLQAPAWTRWPILAAFVYVCLGVNTSIEAAIFTTMGGMGSMVVFNILPCVLFGGALALLFRPSPGGGDLRSSSVRFFAGRTPRQWAWRLLAALCAFPVVYFIFGMSVGPFVIEHYRQEAFELTLPGPGVIVSIQLLRSLLFLLVSLPILIVFSGSRVRLVLCLGLAYFVCVGLYGMIQACWLPASMRVAHSVEILADSLAHAGALAILLVRKAEGHSPGSAANASNPSCTLC